jgi:hypothetical protein
MRTAREDQFKDHQQQNYYSFQERQEQPPQKPKEQLHVNVAKQSIKQKEESPDIEKKQILQTLESFHELLKKCVTEYMSYTNNKNELEAIKTVVGKLHLKKSNAEVILESFNNLKMSTKICNSALKASHVIIYLE